MSWFNKDKSGAFEETAVSAMKRQHQGNVKRIQEMADALANQQGQVSQTQSPYTWVASGGTSSGSVSQSTNIPMPGGSAQIPKLQQIDTTPSIDELMSEVATLKDKLAALQERLEFLEDDVHGFN